VPDALFEAPELPSPTLSFSGGAGPDDPRRFVARLNGRIVSAPTDSSRAVFNAVEVDELPELVGDLRLRYPLGLERAGVSGVVVLEYVVGSDGRVNPGSVRALSSSHPAFFQAALEALRDARFKPARRWGRSIAVLVQQRIRFRQQ
jgi:protein TonB